jgi:hypothetical protein
MTVKELREVISKYDDDKEINIMIEDVHGLQSPLHMALAPLQYHGLLNDGKVFLGGYDFYKGENIDDKS